MLENGTLLLIDFLNLVFVPRDTDELSLLSPFTHTGLNFCFHCSLKVNSCTYASCFPKTSIMLPLVTLDRNWDNNKLLVSFYSIFLSYCESVSIDVTWLCRHFENEIWRKPCQCQFCVNDIDHSFYSFIYSLANLGIFYLPSKCVDINVYIQQHVSFVR